MIYFFVICEKHKFSLINNSAVLKLICTIKDIIYILIISYKNSYVNIKFMDGLCCNYMYII